MKKYEEKEYPEPDMFGTMPAYGLFARHVNGLEVRDVDLTFDKEERRPAVHLHDVNDVDFEHLDAARPADALMFVLRGVRNFALRNSPRLPDMRRERVDRESL